jgi:imidazolonepropionase-like amidohydrolase
MSSTLHGATLIDGSGGDPQTGQAVVVDGGVIRSVGKNAGPQAESIDLSGLTLLPGLIDAHTHLGYAFPFVHFRDVGVMPVAEMAARIFENCGLALDAGFTTVREMSGVDGGVVQAIAAGLVRGPRIFPSGPALSTTGGHGSFEAPFCNHDRYLEVPGLVQKVIVCDSPDAVRHATRTAFRRGATQIKIFASGGVVALHGALSDAHFSVAELRAAVEEAEARDTYVTAHCHNVRSMQNCIEAGLKCIEHGTYLDEATARAMLAADVALVPTLAVVELMRTSHEMFGVPASVVPRLADVGEAMLRSIHLARDVGLTIGSGSDLLGSRQNRRGLELVLKARALGAMAAIVSATSTNARIMRLGDRAGTVEAEKWADLIAVNGDPLAEPELFDDPARVVFVMKAGVVVKDTR